MWGQLNAEGTGTVHDGASARPLPLFSLVRPGPGPGSGCLGENARGYLGELKPDTRVQALNQLR